jgi:hypothetical protein
MKTKFISVLGILMIALFNFCKEKDANANTPVNPPKEPPFSGTIFIDPDIITSADKTTFVSISPKGSGSRTMFDRRVNNWITVNAHLFQVEFDDNLSAEVQVNPEINAADAQFYAEKYAKVIGRLPNVLRSQVQTVWIHLGTEPFGGGNNNLLIHLGQAIEYENSGILEETFVHEASHTSLDPTHANASAWKNAQKTDNTYISTYARDYPTREDIAESFLPYFAVKFKKDRITSTLADTISQAIPNRIKYFDDLKLNMYPYNK